MVVTRQVCELPNCTMGVGDEEGGRWMTPSHFTTIDQTNTAMDRHLKVHEIHQRGQMAQQDGVHPAAKSRAPKIDRPKVEMDIHDLEWDHFLAEWGRFKRSSGLTELREIKDQLWACLSDQLNRACSMSVVDNVALTEELFLATIRDQAVRKHNPMVNQVRFLLMGQQQGEPVGSLAARFRGAANNCAFTVRCEHWQAGQPETSYAEKMITCQLVRSLIDPDVQEKSLAWMADKGEAVTLKGLVTYIETLETGQRDRVFLKGPGTGGLNRSGNWQDPPNKGGQQASKKERCKACMSKYHRKGDEKCKAKDKKCHNCSKIGHYAHCCLDKGKVSGAQSDSDHKPEQAAPQTGG